MLTRLKYLFNAFENFSRLYVSHKPLVSDYNGFVIVDRYEEFRFKYFFLPKKFRQHRNFFKQHGRGFGEDAFHAAWRHLFREFRPINCLEIGVYRGQTISLWKMIQLDLNIEGTVSGLSPLNDSGDAVSSYPNLDYYQDISSNFMHFNLDLPVLIRGYSNETNIKNSFAKNFYDLVYIDGAHDFDTVLNDYRFALEIVKEGGLVCFDDSSLNFKNQGKFQGHPGPSKVVTEYALQELNYLFTCGHLNFFEKAGVI